MCSYRASCVVDPTDISVIKKTKDCTMKKNIQTLILLGTGCFLSATQAESFTLSHVQLAYFVGTHTSDPHRLEYSSPKFVYQYQVERAPVAKKYKSRRLHKTGKMCKKSCWLDRWTGKALSCLVRC